MFTNPPYNTIKKNAFGFITKATVDVPTPYIVLEENPNERENTKFW